MKIDFSFHPKILDSLKGYSAATFHADLVAGVIVGMVALPLSLALAIASGLKPEMGLFAAIIAGFLVSALGGSRVQIGGPAGAFVPLLAPIVAIHGPAALAACALMAGVILFILGVCKLGTMIKYIPFPVVMGFTSGIAVIIISTQIHDFLGLSAKLPADFTSKVRVLAENFHPNGPTVLLSILCTAAIWFWPKKLGWFLPGPIAVMVLATLAAVFFQFHDKFGIATLGSQFGGMPRTLPPPNLPVLSFEEWRLLVPAALTIAVLGAIESLLSAVVADGMIDDRHDSNQELMAQGLANMVMGAMGGMPATGVIARTATNVRSGGRTPVAGMLHAVTILVVLLCAAPLTKDIPLASLSAVLVVVSLRMGEWHRFVRLNRWPGSDVLVFLCAFGLTVAVDLPTAVGTSLILASALLVKRLAETARVESDAETAHDRSGGPASGSATPDGVMVFHVFGALFFGAADKLETALRRTGGLPEVLILRMGGVLTLDATGLAALENLMEKLRKHGKQLILCGPHSQPLFAMTRAGLLDEIGEENVCYDFNSALDRARTMLAER